MKVERNFGRGIQVPVQIQPQIMEQHITVNTPTGQRVNLIMLMAQEVEKM